MRMAPLLTLLTLLAAVAGALYGQYSLFDPVNSIDRGHWTYVAGELLLIRPLLLLIVPVILASAVAAVARIAQPPRIGLALGGTLVYFAITMLLAATLGAAAAAALRPGDLPQEQRERLIASAEPAFEASASVAEGVRSAIANEQDNLATAWMSVLRRALPANLIDDVGRGRMLGLTVLAILVGLGIAVGRERARPAAAFFEALNDALMRIVRWIWFIAPIGIFLLVANAVGAVGLRELTGLFREYAIVVVGALAAHGLIVLPLAMIVTSRQNPYVYFWRVFRALSIGFATSSSLATLPVSLQVATQRRAICERGRGDQVNGHRNGPRARRRGEAACSRAAAGLVLPLGAALNLNGTALFQAAAVVFMSQVYALDLSINEIVVIVITATLAAIGTSGVPAAGLVTMIIVISAVNASLAARSGGGMLPPSAIGILIAVDRLLDMCRTTINVWGDLVGAKIISAIAPDEGADEDERESPRDATNMERVNTA